MILYKDWGKHLRLGNYLYNYAALLNICNKTGQQMALPDYFLWQYLKYAQQIDSGIEQDELFHFRTNTWSREEQDWLYEFFASKLDKNVNINLGSNNQSELWFQDNLEYVKKHLQFNTEAIDRVKNKYSHVISNGKQTIGIGVRRGDFVNHGVFYQIPVDWYTRALEANFPNWRDYNILFFSDHIEEVKGLFQGDNFFFAEPNGTHTHAENFKYYHQDPMEQFILGCLCDHFIGGSSTFSWWQMWYVKHFNGGTVIHSGKNLSDQGEREFGVNSNYYPPDWILYPI